MPELAAIAITTVLSVLVIVDIVGNSLVCVIIKRNREMRTPVNYLLVNLAVADILYAVFMAPNIFVVQFSFIHHPDGVIGQVVCKVVVGGSVAWIGGVSSIFTLLVIAIERYYAVMYPHGNKRKLTTRKLKFLALNFNKKSNACEYMWPEEWMVKVYQTLKWNLVTAVALLVMVVLYSRVVYTLWFKQNDGNQLTHQQIGVLKVRKRVTLMIVAVSIIFGICWGVDQVVYTLMFTANYDVGHVPVAIANTMVLFNAAVNPFVYALLNHHFREKIKRMICCTCSWASRYHPTRELQDIELANSTTPSTQPTQEDHPRSEAIATLVEIGHFQVH
ncbi:pyroglutamylated RF-amide peptide receptor-like isoform X2 [Oculina patagonica]